MRFRLIFFVVGLLLAAAVAKLEDGWDQLEDMLKTEDEEEKRNKFHMNTVQNRRENMQKIRVNIIIAAGEKSVL